MELVFAILIMVAVILSVAATGNLFAEDKKMVGQTLKYAREINNFKGVVDKKANNSNAKDTRNAKQNAKYPKNTINAKPVEKFNEGEQLFWDFYTNNKENVDARTFNYILNQSDEFFESTHNYIQWLFPSDTPSEYNSTAPIFTENLQSKFKTINQATVNMTKALNRMLKYYNLVLNKNIIKPKNNGNLPKLQHETSHEFQRLTRMIRSLYLCNLPHAKTLQTSLLNLANNGKIKPNDTTKNHWEKANTPNYDGTV
jgi:hypothetical protein